MRCLMVAIIALLVPAAAMAKGECKADRKKFCADVTEKADINACLDRHMAELSAECKTHREAKAKKNNAEGSDAHQNPTTGNEPPPLAHAQPQPVCFDESCKEK
jgi:hypothetical protein